MYSKTLILAVAGGFVAGVVIGYLAGDHSATKKHNAKVEELEDKYREIIEDRASKPAEEVIYERELTEDEVSDYARLLLKQQNEDAIKWAKEHGENIDEPYFSDVENRGGVEILSDDEISNHLAWLQNVNRTDKLVRGKVVEQIEERDFGLCGFDEKVYTFYRPDRLMVDRQTDMVVEDSVVIEETFDISWIVDLTNPETKEMTIQQMLINWPREETVWLRDNKHMTDYEIDIVDVEYM